MPPQILIIDDEANQRLMVAEALRALTPACAITTVQGGAEALDLARRLQPDLIITDYHMPVINGLDLIARVRSAGIKSRIILMTAYSSPELFDAAQRLCVDYYLTKPVALTVLRRMTQAALCKRSI
jgi:two-component system, response regulator YesN